MLVSSQFHRMNVLYGAYIYKVGQLKKKKLVIRAFSKTLIICVLLSKGLSLRKTRLALHFNQLFVNPSLLPVRGGKVSQLQKVKTGKRLSLKLGNQLPLGREEQARLFVSTSPPPSGFILPTLKYEYLNTQIPDYLFQLVPSFLLYYLALNIND